ncbi:hypothetical protein PMEGAS67_61330 [Priestia megaterium]
MKILNKKSSALKLSKEALFTKTKAPLLRSNNKIIKLFSYAHKKN